MAERVDAVVVRQRVVAQHGSPEVDVQVAGTGGHRERHLLHGAAVRDGPLTTRDAGNRAGHADVLRLEELDTAGEPHGESAIAERQEDARVCHPGHLGDLMGEGTRLGK